MEAMTSLFTKSSAASAGDTVVSSDDFGTNGALPSSSSSSSSGSGGFGQSLAGMGDPFTPGASQKVPFVGPVVSIFQAFNDERDARRGAARLDFNAKQEELIGKAQTVTALRILNDVQAINVVNAFAGGNLAGSRGRVAQDVNRDADIAFTLIRTNAEIKSADLKQKANIIRKVARFDRNVAVGKSLFRFGSQAVAAGS